MSIDWKKTLATVAPVLATAFGGPMAGVAAQMAGKALGLGDGVSEQQIAEAVASGDPSVLVKLRQADNDFKAQMKELNVDIKRLNVQDRDSARNLGISKGLGAQIVLSAIFVAGYFYTLDTFIDLMVSQVKIDETYIVLLSTLVGVLTAGMVQIMNYWFGSSSGSKDKSTAMAGLIK